MANQTKALAAAPITWAELTQYEQNEAINRGFPRDRGVRYVVKGHYDQDKRDWSLVRWTRDFAAGC